MAPRRQDRVRELLKRAVGEVIRREISVSEGGLITVNDVGVTPDLKSATVFISILGGPEQKKKGQSILNEKGVWLQMQVAREIILKYTPRLRFVVDDSIERGNRVLHILEELEKKNLPDATEE
ncbi:MAG: 30S ribosome-binding factor RbfA [Pedosphaera sp.]|nr:30S ribosome-binding factor RbfA [Pedosphaera sp.]MSS99926.1 30S ribosome-binding factor RbfA [Pedosphaera sp.]